MRSLRNSRTVAVMAAVLLLWGLIIPLVTPQTAMALKPGWSIQSSTFNSTRFNTNWPDDYWPTPAVGKGADCISMLPSWDYNCEKNFESYVMPPNGIVEHWYMHAITLDQGDPNQCNNDPSMYQAPSGIGYRVDIAVPDSESWGGACIPKGNNPPTFNLVCDVTTIRVYEQTICHIDNARDPDTWQTLSYKWSSGKTTLDSTFVGYTKGMITVQASVSDGIVQTTKTAFVNVVNADPTVTISCQKTTLQPNEQTACTATAQDADGDTITLTFAGLTQTGPTPVKITIPNLSFPVPGQYDVLAEADDGKGGKGTGQVTITVSGGLTPNIDCQPNPADLVNGSPQYVNCTVTSVSGGVGPYSYRWENNNDPATSATSKYGPYTAVGTDTAKVTVTDGTGKTGGGQRTIQIVDTQSGSPPAGGCSGTTSCNRSPSVRASCPSVVDPYMDFTCYATGSDSDGDALSYNWAVSGSSYGVKIGPDDYGGDSTMDFAFDTGNYTLKVTVDDGNGGTASASRAVCVRNWDGRSVRLAMNPKMVKAPNLVDATASVTGSVQGSATLTAGWGEQHTMTQTRSDPPDPQYGYPGGSSWADTFFIPKAMKGQWTFTASAILTQPDGCGGRYGPDVVTGSFDIMVVSDAPEQPPLPIDENLIPANLALVQYTQDCLGSPEPYYCGINVEMAQRFIPDIRSNETYYISQLGRDKYQKLLRRVDAALQKHGFPASGLRVPAP